jgi:hypothetical protein
MHLGIKETFGPPLARKPLAIQVKSFSHFILGMLGFMGFPYFLEPLPWRLDYHVPQMKEGRPSIMVEYTNNHQHDDELQLILHLISHYDPFCKK